MDIEAEKNVRDINEDIIVENQDKKLSMKSLVLGQ
jgi:hypothetical protein